MRRQGRLAVRCTTAQGGDGENVEWGGGWSKGRVSCSRLINEGEERDGKERVSISFQ